MTAKASLDRIHEQFKTMATESTNQKQAIIRISGAQYVVSEDEVIEVNRLTAKKDEKINPEVLLISDSKSTEVGTPTLDTKVTVEVVKHKKGVKVEGLRFKAKSRYRRRYGYRPSLTVLKVTKIG